MGPPNGQRLSATSSAGPPHIPHSLPPAALHSQLSWFTQPYVQQLRYARGSDTLEATTLTLLARPRVDRFHIAEVCEVEGVHPLSSFQVSSCCTPGKHVAHRLGALAACLASTRCCCVALLAARLAQQQRVRAGNKRARNAPPGLLPQTGLLAVP